MLARRVRGFGRTWTALSDVLADWPSMHDLLPEYNAVLDGRPGEGAGKAPHELALPRLRPDLARSAVATHETVQAAWGPDGCANGVPLVPYSGTGQRTLQGAVWDGQRLTFQSGQLEWQPEGPADGDGTVPTRCAVPRGADWGRTEGASCRHGWLVELGDVIERVKRILQGGEYLDGGASTRPGDLGLDLDDMLLVAGDRLHAKVALVGPGGEPAASDGGGVALRVRPARSDAPWQELTLERCGLGEWSASSPPLEAGKYQVEASAPKALGRDRPPVQELVAVADGHDVDEKSPLGRAGESAPLAAERRGGGSCPLRRARPGESSAARTGQGAVPGARGGSGDRPPARTLGAPGAGPASLRPRAGR